MERLKNKRLWRRKKNETELTELNENTEEENGASRWLQGNRHDIPFN